ncbi:MULTISPECIES: DUF2505 domain-containing protein [unclassified Aeromicrobium]|jgi:hypothetical protein|uniref:DUF2505 domain-containing protein n=1 Tax=unclassified Aeromicrobium TaxID=2633570 RepID=UPI0020976276|nr:MULTISPECIES: DUF2505 domain-containing protein [unclassified Aeromicrobium]MCO7241007.1 DUF2505 domain-containing protein [Aeromicrobium sp. CnD17-E]MDR6120304.1 hypothetical protein [Aeromicrobium sp. SORGH_AS_0981]
MKINETHSYGDADVEAVFGLISSEAFRTEAAEDAGASDIDVDVTESGGAVTITIVRTQPAEMPDFVKKLTGDTVKVKQTEKWSKPESDGSRKADVKVSIIGQPAEMLGTAVLEAKGGGTSFTVAGDVTVKIPFIGKKIEPEVAKAIKGSLKHEVELGKTRL